MEPTLTPDSELKTWENPHKEEDENIHRADRWSFTSNVREAILMMALRQVGLEPDGTPYRLPDGSLAPKLPNRERIAAIKVITGLDKNMIDARREFLASGCEPCASAKAHDELIESIISEPDVRSELRTIHQEHNLAQCSIAERVKEGDRERAEALLMEEWPLSWEARQGIISATIEMCGFSVGDDGNVVPILEIEHQPCSRTRMAAMRLFGIFDRLSRQFRRIEKRLKEFKIKRGQLHGRVLTSEGSEKMVDAINRGCIRKFGVKLGPTWVV